MSRCLFCGEELTNSSINGWHNRCILKMFCSIDEFNELNSIDFTNLLNKTLEDGDVVPGVQCKLSYANTPYTHISKLNDSYILKFNSEELPNIAEAEHLVMSLADIFKINTAMHGLVRINEKYVYVTKRFDRKNKEKIHMEDFCQLSNKISAFKYESSCEQLFKIINRYSSQIQLDSVNLYKRIIFSFLTGNSDMHLKNYSLIEEINKRYLSAAYDLLPVNLIFKKDKDETALTINEKKRNLRKKDFLILATKAGLKQSIAIKIINNLCDYNKYEQKINESFLPDSLKEEFKLLIKERINRIL